MLQHSFLSSISYVLSSFFFLVLSPALCEKWKIEEDSLLLSEHSISSQHDGQLYVSALTIAHYKKKFL